VKERKLRHREEAEEFYRQLKVSGKQVRVFCPVLSSQCGSLDPSLRYE
jgi:hypothetical protein